MLSLTNSLITRDLGDVLIAAGRAAGAHDVALLLVVDEVQALPADQMSPLFGALQRTAKHDPDPELGTRLPILALFAGLRDARSVLKRRAGTYAERVREWPLGLLDAAAAAAALSIPATDRNVRWDPDGLDDAVAAAAGYPYALQVIGYESWAAASARAGDDRIRPADVARARLIERGLLRATGHGRVTVALPGLERHLRAADSTPPHD